MKKYIPNILTFFRLFITPVIAYLGITKHYYALLIVFIIFSFTDYLDGKLARKWNVVSDFGAKLDMISDKMFAFSILLIILLKYCLFTYMFILEILIGLFNIYSYYKIKWCESLMMGKVKTWVINITMVMGIIALFVPQFFKFAKIAIIISIIFQILTLYLYVRNYLIIVGQKSHLIKLYKEYYEIVKNILNSKEFKKRKKYEHHYNESVYDHCLKVSFDAFCYAKKHGMDYKSAAIAGLLHDFYDKPWQEINEKVPFLKKHGFVHAHEALENSKKYFSEYMNPVIENSIERHMFPLNKIPPKYKEGWLIMITDKKDSLDFLIHPSAFMKCFINKKDKK